MLAEITKLAFENGSDYFGETPTGEVLAIEYSTLAKQYIVAIKLDKGTAGIGFTQIDEDTYEVISGHSVFEIKSPILTEELSHAHIVLI